jgi:hypothetical protein
VAKRSVKTLSGIFLATAMLILSASVPAAAMDWAVTGGPVSFFPAGKALPSGLYAQIGMRGVLTPRIELEILTMPQITPTPFSSGAAGILIGINLLEDLEPSYFHMLADAGILWAFRQGESQPALLLHARVSPLSIGNPAYAYRERLFTIGALYDIEDGALTWTFSTWIHNWFMN